MDNVHNIKGEYFFDIQICTMFDVYNIRTKNTNLITHQGIDFFLNKWVNSESNDVSEYIGYIATGKGNKNPEKSDTSLNQDEHIFTNTKVEVESNKIILTVDSDGNVLNRSKEIGVYTTKNRLVSRDVHETYYLPTTSTVKITYNIILNQTDVSEIEEEVDYND